MNGGIGSSSNIILCTIMIPESPNDYHGLTKIEFKAEATMTLRDVHENILPSVTPVIRNSFAKFYLYYTLAEPSEAELDFESTLSEIGVVNGSTLVLNTRDPNKIRLNISHEDDPMNLIEVFVFKDQPCGKYLTRIAKMYWATRSTVVFANDKTNDLDDTKSFKDQHVEHKDKLTVRRKK